MTTNQNDSLVRAHQEPTHILPSYEELLAKLKTLSPAELKNPVRAVLNLPGNYLACPVASLVNMDISVGDQDTADLPLLHLVSHQMVIPRTATIALEICKSMGIETTESAQFAGQWIWTLPKASRSSKQSYVDQEDAAKAAVGAFFSSKDWLYLVNNGDTQLGYFEWAFNESFQFELDAEEA